ncbi:MAG: transcription-repair coupling factor [Bacillota bacterium]
MNFNNILLSIDKTKNLIKDFSSGHDVEIYGMNNSRFPFLAGNIFPKVNKTIVIITHDTGRANDIYEDLIRLLPAEKLAVFPQMEVLPHEQIMTDYSVTIERLQVLEKVVFDNGNNIIILPVGAIIRKLIPYNIFKKYALNLKVAKEVDRENFIERLSILGYERVEMIEDPRQFSVRGGIIDIFSLTNNKPYRIEFFGDEIDSIREFSLESQRSIEEHDKIIIPPARENFILPDSIKSKTPIIKKDIKSAVEKLKNINKSDEAKHLEEKGNEALEKLEELNYFPGYEQFLPYFYNKLDSFLNYLPKEHGIFIDNPERVWQRIQNQCREIEETQATLLEQGSILPSYSNNFFNKEDIRQKIIKSNTLYFSPEFGSNPFESDIKEYSFKTRGVEPYHGQLDMFAERLRELREEGFKVAITLNTTKKAERINEFLKEKELAVFHSEEQKIKDNTISVFSGSFSEGFIIDEINFALYTEREVMGKPQKKKRKLADLEDGVEISSINELTPGDYVVHENHGIGKYLGVNTLEIQNQHQDYLVIQYADEDKLYVPTEKVNLVQKYIGADHKRPKLYKLGGNEWKKVKQKVKNSVKEMAIGLLELYAERETIEGYSFSEDTVWQNEFEDAFPYEETPDQMEAIEDVKEDMESSMPMDRLLCGDVGYGKTEVAIRAAFKAAMDGKQTAVLVPTTILAQQHFTTFSERIGKFPITIDMISRFKTTSEQKKTLKKVRRGEVDVIIGTHRLLSEDVKFNDLGLLIVDEEQRFGVSHKERIKDIKKNVDVLTLTATPIPRTLHMALVGVRDMSVIETPPENRYPIRTYIREFNKQLVKETIRREIGRGGQVYFVHNRVADIDKKADMIRKLLPDARVAVAHGQMNENKLEKLMVDFYNHNYDILVCTTIIETGLDIPNVNTIIINRAENMGLAQLYQLRGRVGRSNRIAYAYLLYEKDRVLSEVAEKRLRAIQEFTNLGSGFKIAMRDLEIRGAGNLLGAEQHGHIASIGFSLYCKLLENAVEELKGEKEEKKKEVEINLNEDAYIPDGYISDSKQKIDIYKKIMKADNSETIMDIIDELIDRFGDPPEVVINLIEISRIKIIARRLGIEKIEKKDNTLINSYFEDQDKLNGDVVMEMIEKYPKRLKIRSASKPIIGIKIKKNDDRLNLLKNILEDLKNLLYNE